MKSKIRRVEKRREEKRNEEKRSDEMRREAEDHPERSYTVILKS
jgi:hypothetical protein